MATPDETGALLQKIAGGCCLSFDRIYRRTSRHLLAVILRLNGHRGESEELLQETFLKVWKESWRFDPLRSTGNTWLTVLARNTALDSLRRRHARPKFNAAADAETSEPDVLGHVESPSRPAAESFDAKALSFHIASSLRELDPKLRQCVCLAFFSGLSHAEIAVQLDMPLGTVKSRVRRSLVQLKQPLLMFA